VYRDSWWDYCTVSTNSLSSTVRSNAFFDARLTTFSGMWLHMFGSTVMAVAGVYFIVGGLFVCKLAGKGGLSRSEALGVLLKSPPVLLALGLAGICHAALPGGLFAAVVALMYLSIPYDIGADVATVLGCTMASIVLFFAFNRDQPHHAPVHAVDYAE